MSVSPGSGCLTACCRPCLHLLGSLRSGTSWLECFCRDQIKKEPQQGGQLFIPPAWRLSWGYFDDKDLEIWDSEPPLRPVVLMIKCSEPTIFWDGICSYSQHDYAIIASSCGRQEILPHRYIPRGLKTDLENLRTGLGKELVSKMLAMQT